jgi:thiol-disulfide isomerase/thioredoxin
MKPRYFTKLIPCLAVLSLAALSAQVPAPAQTPAAAPEKSSPALPESDPLLKQLQSLVGKVREKLKSGKTDEASFAPELKEFDQLIADNPNASQDVLAQVALLKATLYLQVFDEPAKGTDLLKKIKSDYPNSPVASRVDMMIAQFNKQAEAKTIQSALKPGSPFPDFNVKDLAGKPLSVADRKGKVVLVDFWATWCGPCREELPNVIATYKKYHDQGFDIIGVSLDSDRDKLDAFLKKQDGMTWQQFFDGQGWNNELAVKYGVEAIPFTVLIGPDGKIIGTDLRGEKLGTAVGDALAKK